MCVDGIQKIKASVVVSGLTYINGVRQEPIGEVSRDENEVYDAIDILTQSVGLKGVCCYVSSASCIMVYIVCVWV